MSFLLKEAVAIGRWLFKPKAARLTDERAKLQMEKEKLDKMLADVRAIATLKDEIEAKRKELKG